jgi:hypothetical protein
MSRRGSFTAVPQEWFCRRSLAAYQCAARIASSFSRARSRSSWPPADGLPARWYRAGSEWQLPQRSSPDAELLKSFESQRSDNWFTGHDRSDWSRPNRQFAPVQLEIADLLLPGPIWSPGRHDVVS